jgi:hypothetical protein
MVSNQSKWTEIYLSDLHDNFIGKRFEANASILYKLISNQ